MNPFISFFIKILLMLFIVWALIWKAIAMWHAAGRKKKGWFVAIFIFNTAGILDLVYLFRITRRPVFLWAIGVSLALVAALLLELAKIAPLLPLAH